ncbi:MAG: hypothetical protein KA998_00390 [Rickettsiaceae bacterium]|nr:hypothetical protein [Rickettsiaceae bacterium]
MSENPNPNANDSIAVKQPDKFTDVPLNKDPKNLGSEMSPAKKNTISFNSIPKSEVEDIVSKSSPQENATNISDAHAALLSDFCNANDTYAVLRPVNETARHWLARGAVGKNMFVHGKSVASGPASGLISFNASISKAANRGEESIKLSQHDNEHSIEQSDKLLGDLEKTLKAAAARLVIQGIENPSRKEILNAAKVSEEAFDPILQKVQLSDRNGSPIYILTNADKFAAKDQNGKHVYVVSENGQYYAIDDNHDRVNQIDIPESLKLEPLELIGKPEIEIASDGSISTSKIRPITADIDVLAYGSKENLREGAMEDHTSLLIEQKTKFLQAMHFPQDFIEDFSAKPIDYLKQNYPKETTIIDQLEAIESKFVHLRGMGGATRSVLDITGAMRADFHHDELSHGSEQFNYYFPQPLDKEWVVVNPKGEVKVVTGESGLLALFNEAKVNGYSMPPSPHWGWTMDRAGRYVASDELKKTNDFVNSVMYKEDKDITLRDKVAANRLLLGLAHTSTPEEWSSSLAELEPKMRLVGINEGINDVGRAISLLEENQTKLNDAYKSSNINKKSHIERSPSMYEVAEKNDFIQNVRASMSKVIEELQGVIRRKSINIDQKEEYTPVLPNPQVRPDNTKKIPQKESKGNVLKVAADIMSGVAGFFVQPDKRQKSMSIEEAIAKLKGVTTKGPTAKGITSEEKLREQQEIKKQ